MKLFQAYHLLIFLSLETPKYAKKGCRDKCGDVMIPYPFGIGASCSINKWFNVDCNSSTPYLPALKNLEVLKVHIGNQTVIVGTQRMSSCQKPVRNSSQKMSIDLGWSPFLYSKDNNKLVFDGCGTASLMENGSVLAACSTACGNATLSDRSNCLGNGCCETAIPHYLKSYNINITGLEEEDGNCTGSAFLVDKTLYEQGRFSDPFIPISLTWTLTDSNQVTCCRDYNPTRSIVEMSNGTSVDTWLCDEYGDGSPYLIDGCAMTYSDSTPDTEMCRKCSKRGGYCTSNDSTYDGRGSFLRQNYICVEGERTPRGVILGNVFSLCF
ncbi:putative wall-associated receptor kinase, galacturonan-binding domain-containing protein [Helianthus anomalus]